MLDILFGEPQKAYLRPEDLNLLSQFVSSLPERINFYRRLRNEEATLLQAVADSLQQQFPEEPEGRLKRSLQNGVLILRHAAMAMLMDDPDFVARRLASWLPEVAQGYGTESIDRALGQLIKQHFAGRFSPQQLSLLFPGIDAALNLLTPVSKAQSPVDDTLVSLF